MDKIMIYILFSIIVMLLLVIMSIIYTLAKKWKDAYLKLKEKHNKIIDENAKLRHDLYNLTYNPVSKTKKGENKNGTK